MINDFQKALINNKDICWEIVKIFHPEVNLSLKDKLNINTLYDWITLSIKGNIDIGIEFECKLMSGNKSLHLFVEEVKNNSFKAWRFSKDKKFSLEKGEEYNYLRILYNKLLNDLLTINNISKPTAEQMSKYYHSG